MECVEAELLLGADMDGELDAVQSAALASHVAGCVGCARLRAGLSTLQATMRVELRAWPAPAGLRRRFVRRWRWPEWRLPGAFMGGAVAAGLLLVSLPRAPASFDNALISGHLRALQPGHLVDVASNDQHNVKPWFDGRLDYAPPVKNLADAGFVLDGGRLDAVGGRPVAVLVYRFRLHVIDVFVWPTGVLPAVPDGSRLGYDMVRWSQDGFEFQAVSDVNVDDLRRFGRLWRATE